MAGSEPTREPVSGDGAPFFVRHRYVVVALVAIAMYVPFLAGWELWYPDEPDIGEVAVAMYESGDWVAPRRMGVIWVDYPPLLYWVGVASSHLTGGVSAFSLRLPNALAAVALVLVTAVAGGRMFGASAGLWAGLAMATFQQFVLQAVGYRPDVLFALFIAAGLLVYAAGVGARPRWWLRVVGFGLLGVAMLAKGPLGLLLPGLVLTLWHGSRREWRRLLELPVLACVSIAVYLPWFVACAKAMGADNILYELYAQNVARFLAGDRGHAQPVWYYATGVWTDLLPWGVLVPFAVWWGARRGMGRDPSYQLAGWWFGAFFVFLSIAVTKRQLYLLPAYPAAALLLAPWLAAMADTLGPDRPPARPLRIYGWAVAGLYVVLGAALLVGAGPAFQTVLDRTGLRGPEVEAALQVRLPLALVAAVLVSTAAWLAAALFRRRDRSVLLALVAGHVVLYIVAFAFVFPAMNPTKSYRQAAEWVGDHIGDEPEFGMYWPEDNLGFRKMGAFGYFSGKHVTVLYEPSEVQEYLVRHPGSVVVVHESAEPSLPATEEWRRDHPIVRDDLYTGGKRYAVVAGSP
jgi:4-amino-4-deoxy-L-arabinose transferase-like glycosyltransferase